MTIFDSKGRKVLLPETLYESIDEASKKFVSVYIENGVKNIEPSDYMLFRWELFYTGKIIRKDKLCAIIEKDVHVTFTGLGENKSVKYRYPSYEINDHSYEDLYEYLATKTDKRPENVVDCINQIYNFQLEIVHALYLYSKVFKCDFSDLESYKRCVPFIFEDLIIRARVNSLIDRKFFAKLEEKLFTIEEQFFHEMYNIFVDILISKNQCKIDTLKEKELDLELKCSRLWHEMEILSEGCEINLEDLDFSNSNQASFAVKNKQCITNTKQIKDLWLQLHQVRGEIKGLEKILVPELKTKGQRNDALYTFTNYDIENFKPTRKAFRVIKTLMINDCAIEQIYYTKSLNLFHRKYFKLNNLI